MQTDHTPNRSPSWGGGAMTGSFWLSFSLCFYPPMDAFLSRVAGLSLLGLALLIHKQGSEAEAKGEPGLKRVLRRSLWFGLALAAWMFAVEPSAGSQELAFGALVFSALANVCIGRSAWTGSLAFAFLFSAIAWAMVGWSEIRFGAWREAVDGAGGAMASAVGFAYPLSLTQTALETLPCWVCVGSMLTRAHSRKASAISVLSALAALHTSRLAALGCWGPGSSPEWLVGPLLGSTAASGFLILLLVSLWLSKPRRLQGLARSKSPRISRVAAVGAVAVATLGIVGIFVIQRECSSGPSRGEETGSIVLYEERESPIQDFETPKWGHYGPGGMGMFGVLCDELRADGHDVQRARGILTAESLATCDLFVLFNVTRQWTKLEFLAIWNFVQKGGNLLVVTDHTDVQGTMRASNNVLAPFGLQVNFDSVLPAHPNGWFRPSISATPEFSRLESAQELHWSVGASLSLEGSRARPLVSFPYALVDHGDRAAVDRALLGNYALDSGEFLGEVVVAAESSFGEGRVIVLGDSGCFQNVAVARTYEDWGWQLFAAMVGGREARCSDLLRDVLWTVSWALLMGALWGLRRSRVLTWILSAAACLALVAAQTAVQARFETPSRHAPRLLIDESHYSLLASYRREEDGCSSFVRGFQREGWTAEYMSDFDPRRLKAADAVALLAPQASYGRSEVASFVAYVEAGGSLILSVGAPHAEPVRGLLDAFEISVTPSAVGSIPLRKDPERVKARVEFMDAWVVQSHAEGDDSPVWVLADYQGYPLALLSERGQGRVLLVGDSRFFSDSNLESSVDYIEPNLLFLRSLIEELEREDPS